MPSARALGKSDTMPAPNGFRSFDLDTPLDLPAPLAWRPVKGRFLCIAPKQPNWLTTDRTGATLLAALSWGETPRAALRFAGQTTGEPPESLAAGLTALMSSIERHAFYAGAKREELDIATANRAIHIYLTNRCNLHCAQCYMAAGGGDTTGELSADEWRRVLAQFTSLNQSSSVSFSGGEPLLRPDLLDLAGRAHDDGHYVTLFTNGTLIREEMTARLAGVCNCVQLSLDGATTAVHDAIRGPGAFAATVRAIEGLRNRGVRLRIALTVMPENSADLAANLVGLLMKLGGTELDVVLNNALPEGRARSGHFCPEPANMQAAVSGILRQLWAAGWPGAAPRRRRAPRHNCGYGGGLILAADGDVFPCPILGQSVGNVRKSGLAELADRLTRVYEETTVEHMEECGACDLRLICGGGCRTRNLRDRGDLLRSSCSSQWREELYLELAGIAGAGSSSPWSAKTYRDERMALPVASGGEVA
jgi:radical SAM protein with 4Fe4S-binding SPASM domain